MPVSQRTGSRPVGGLPHDDKVVPTVFASARIALAGLLRNVPRGFCSVPQQELGNMVDIRCVLAFDANLLEG